MDDARELCRAWATILGRLELELSTHNFATWLRGSRALGCEQGTLVVESPAAVGCEWLNERLITVVERVTEQVTGQALRVHFIPRRGPGSEDRDERAAPDRERSALPIVGSLNRAFTFERYLPAEGNLLAYRACASVFASDEGPAISPVVIYGLPGLGKTHLLHAAAARGVAMGWAVACLSAEQFTSRYQGALRRNEVDSFHSALRETRLLALDDLQYLEGKRATMDELTHTIDAVANSGGHVVVAGERHPDELDLPARLKSRLAAGLVLRVGPFVGCERRNYIDRLAAECRVGLPTFAVDRIAGIEAPSVRVLQGAVHAAVALARGGMLELRRLDAELARVTVAQGCSRPLDSPALEAIARYFATTADELAGRSRKPRIAEARAVAVVALRRRGLSLARVGEALGGRDRSTISQLETRGQALGEADPGVRALLSA